MKILSLLLLATVILAHNFEYTPEDYHVCNCTASIPPHCYCYHPEGIQFKEDPIKEDPIIILPEEQNLPDVKVITPL
jgi:hypothetical protein